MHKPWNASKLQILTKIKPTRKKITSFACQKNNAIENPRKWQKTTTGKKKFLGEKRKAGRKGENEISAAVKIL